MLPSQFAAVVDLYESGSEIEKDEISRHVMTRIIADPGYARLMLSKVIGERYQNHLLYRQMTAALFFAKGDLAASYEEFLTVKQLSKIPFNFLCLARVLLAQGLDDKAESILTKGLMLFPDDSRLTMELATQSYRKCDIDMANSLAETILPEFAAEHSAIAPLQREIDHAIKAELLRKPAEHDIYDDEFVLAAWASYYRSYISDYNEYQDGTVALDSGIRREVGRLFKNNLCDVTTFIDFGAFCGYMLSKLAEEFPSVQFVGVDRPPIVKSLNESAFARRNIEFVAADVLDFLDARGSLGKRPVLFHSRTAVFCYPAFLRHLYRQARERGVRDIIFQEGSTYFSRSALCFFIPGKYPQISYAGRGSTILHDYKKILELEGFKIKSSTDIRPKLLLDDGSGFGADHRVVHAELI